MRLKLPFASGRKTQIVACSNWLRLRAKSLDSASKSDTNEEDAYEAGTMATASLVATDEAGMVALADANDLKDEDFDKTPWACRSCRVNIMNTALYRVDAGPWMKTLQEHAEAHLLI